jgi:Cu/Ag efflux pump CusA
LSQVRIVLDRRRAQLYGVQVGDLAELLETALNGRVVGQVLDGQRTYDVFVWYAEPFRGDVSAIGDMLVDTPSGEKVPLSLLADVREAKGRNIINRENVRRRIVVLALELSLEARGVALRQLDAGDRRLHLDHGGAQVAARDVRRQDATRLIALLSLFTLVTMVLLLYTHFRSAMIVGQILLTPAVFFRFGRRAAERYLAREAGNPLDAIPAVAPATRSPLETSG